MKITLLANRDLASNLALNQLLPRLSQHHQLQVFLSSRVGSGTDLPEPLRMLKFFEQTLFNDILFPSLDRCRSGNGLYSFSQLAQFAASPITVLNQINSEGGLATLAASSPDLVICIRYGGILKDRVIAIPRHGVINLHSGLLPDYRGVMATFRALLHGETEIGTTLHYNADTVAGSTATKRNDGAGATLLPGLIDAHGHILNHGRLLSSVNLVGSPSEADSVQRPGCSYRHTDRQCHEFGV
jgi:methionyl-tRNA formyltransferase